MLQWYFSFLLMCFFLFCFVFFFTLFWIPRFSCHKNIGITLVSRIWILIAINKLLIYHKLTLCDLCESTNCVLLCGAYRKYCKEARAVVLVHYTVRILKNAFAENSSLEHWWDNTTFCSWIASLEAKTKLLNH